jgi:hypothetical protein
VIPPPGNHFEQRSLGFSGKLAENGQQGKFFVRDLFGRLWAEDSSAKTNHIL